MPRRATFSVRSRLNKGIEFKRVFKKPTVSSDRCFKVLSRMNGGDFPRLGMAVSRQVDRRAVGRNRIKRIIRESFRQTLSARISWASEGSGAGGDVDRKLLGIDIVVLPRREAATICNYQLFRSLEAHWSRIGETLSRKQDKN